jgi:EAL domain-containing protein (putative c-di-GMP-specific phosphodiesterase class I)
MSWTQRKTHPKLRLLIHQTVASVAAEQWLPWFRDQMVRRNLIRRRPLLQFQMVDVRDHLDAAKPLVDVLRKYGIQVCVANVSGNAADLDLLADLPVALAKLSFATLMNADPGRADPSGAADQNTWRIRHRCRNRRSGHDRAGLELPPDYIQGNSLQMPSSD